MTNKICENLEEIIGNKISNKLKNKKCNEILEIIGRYLNNAIVSEKFVIITYDHRYKLEKILLEEAIKKYNKEFIIILSKNICISNKDLSNFGIKTEKCKNLYLIEKINKMDLFKILCNFLC